MEGDYDTRVKLVNTWAAWISISCSILAGVVGFSAYVVLDRLDEAQARILVLEKKVDTGILPIAGARVSRNEADIREIRRELSEVESRLTEHVLGDR